MARSDSALHSLLSSAVLVAVGGMIGSFSKLVERVIVGRMLRPAAYGEVSIGIIVLSLGTTVAMLGYTQATARYMSRYDDAEHHRGIWASGLLVPGTLALVVAGVLFVQTPLLSSVLFDGAGSVRLLQLFVLAIPLTVAFRLAVNSIRGFENTRYKILTKDLLFPFVRIGAVVLLLWLGYGVLAVGYAYLLATFVAVVLAHLLLNRLVTLVGPVRTHVREMTRFGAPLVIATMLSMLLIRTDTLMVGYFSGSYAAGQYSAAYPLANGMLIVLSAFGFLYLPLASRLDADGEREEIDRIYKTTTKWIFVVTFPAFLTFVAFPEDVLRIVFGPAYVEASLTLVILSIGFFANAFGGRNRETLSALGYTKYLLVANGTAYGLNLLLNIALIPRLGYEGAAVASAASLITLNGVVLAYLYTQFDISPISRYSRRTFLVLPAVMLPPALLLSRWISLSVVTIVPFVAFVGLCSVGVVSLAGGLQPEDGVVLEFVENQTGLRIPYVRSYLPAEAAEPGEPS